MAKVLNETLNNNNNNNNNSKEAFDASLPEKIEQKNLKTQNTTILDIESYYGFRDLKHDNVIRATGYYVKKYYKPSKNCFKNVVSKRLPITVWLPNYDIKKNLLKDIIGGLTVIIS